MSQLATANHQNVLVFRRPRPEPRMCQKCISGQHVSCSNRKCPCVCNEADFSKPSVVLAS